jgi:hypothetical protein
MMARKKIPGGGSIHHDSFDRDRQPDFRQLLTLNDFSPTFYWVGMF